MAQKLLVKFSQRDTIDLKLFSRTDTPNFCRFFHLFISHFNKLMRKFRHGDHEVDVTSLARHQDVEFIKIANSTGFSIRFLLAPTGVRVIKTNIPGIKFFCEGKLLFLKLAGAEKKGNLPFIKSKCLYLKN